jgi:hypothetical protein
MPQLRPSLTRARALVTVVIVVAAGCGTSAPGPGSPQATTSSATVVYTLTESGAGKPAEHNHGKPVDIEWDAATSTFFVVTSFDGTIYQGRLDDPNVPVYIEGTLGQTALGIKIARGQLYVAGGMSGQIRVYNLATKALVGHFETGSGGVLIDLEVTDAGDVWATDGARPVLWHLTPQQVAAGSGTPTALPVGPEIPYTPDPNNLIGIVAVSDQRLLVDDMDSGALYRIELDPHAPRGRTITLVSGATVREGTGMLLDGRRLVVADFHGLSILNLSDDAQHATALAPIRDPSFHEPVAVAHAADRYLVTNADFHAASSTPHGR